MNEMDLSTEILREVKKEINRQPIPGRYVMLLVECLEFFENKNETRAIQNLTTLVIVETEARTTDIRVRPTEQKWFKEGLPKIIGLLTQVSHLRGWIPEGKQIKFTFTKKY